MIHVSIDDYLDGLLSGTAEPSKKAIMKLTKLIENFGAIMVKSTERMEDYMNNMDGRLNALESALGVAASAARAAPAAPAAPVAAPTAAAPAVAAPVAAASSGAPNLSAAPSTPNLSAAAPNLSATPDLSSQPAPSGAQGQSGGGITSDDLMKAVAGLQKAPEPVPGDPGAPEGTPAFSPFGVSANDIQDVRAGLTKVDPDEHRKERQQAAGGTEGSMPASMAMLGEVKDALAKRASRSSEGDDEETDFAPSSAPAAPVKSTKQMKEALQGELRDAFSSLLESDTKED
ncbi:MAG: hypothetical protein ACTSQF_11350 [Candidatus Heimdallarchaeaceae archaeon]